MYILAGVCISLTTVLIQLYMGRTIHANDGSSRILNFSPDITECGSDTLFDWYSFVHVTHGVILFYGLPHLLPIQLSPPILLLVALVIECIWEIVENSSSIINRYRTQTGSVAYNGDTIVNSQGDILSMLVGYILAWSIPGWASTILVLTSEYVLVCRIQDNLILTIVMLFGCAPKSLREWQRRSWQSTKMSVSFNDSGT